MKLFEDYKNDAPNQITMANGAFYPDILVQACEAGVSIFWSTS